MSLVATGGVLAAGLLLAQHATRAAALTVGDTHSEVQGWVPRLPVANSGIDEDAAIDLSWRLRYDGTVEVRASAIDTSYDELARVRIVLACDARLVNPTHTGELLELGTASACDDPGSPDYAIQVFDILVGTEGRSIVGHPVEEWTALGPDGRVARTPIVSSRTSRFNHQAFDPEEFVGLPKGSALSVVVEARSTEALELAQPDAGTGSPAVVETRDGESIVIAARWSSEPDETDAGLSTFSSISPGFVRWSDSQRAGVTQIELLAAGTLLGAALPLAVDLTFRMVREGRGSRSYKGVTRQQLIRMLRDRDRQ